MASTDSIIKTKKPKTTPTDPTEAAAKTKKPKAAPIKLTDVTVKAAKPTDTPRKLGGEKGMYLLVNPTGSKLWRFKYSIDGKEKLMALGMYPDVSLAQARDKRDEARKQLAADIDPMATRHADKVARRLAVENSFAAVARLWWEQWRANKKDNHNLSAMRRLERHVFPAIGKRPISKIEAPELVVMVKAIAKGGALDIARRALQMTSQVFRFAIAHGLASRNPALDFRPSDILESRKKENHARVDSSELPDLLRRIEGYAGTATTRLAIKLMALTFVRTGELIGGRWEEIEWDAALWRIPASRMKVKTPHIVPLAAKTIEVLRTLQLITGHSALLFPNQSDHSKPMSNNTILQALKRMGYQGKMTGHGFRGVASTILHEQGFDHAHIELQLAHQDRDEISAAYNHATYLAPRKVMMQQWANYLSGITNGATIIPIHSGNKAA